MSAAPPVPPSLLRRVWRWARWWVLAGVLLVAVLSVLHRAILLWAINRYGPDAASSAGLDLKMKASGSLWSDFSLKSVSATGDDDKIPLKSLRLGELSLIYDLLPVWQKEYLKVPKSIVLHDVEATIDLTHPSTKSDESVSSNDPKALVDLLKQLTLPSIDLQHVSATLLLPSAPGEAPQSLRIQDLCIAVTDGKHGTLSIAKVEHPALAKYSLENLRATFTLEGTHFTLESFELMPGVSVDRLMVDLAGYARGWVSIESALHSRDARLDLKATASVNTNAPSVDVDLTLQDVDTKEVADWVPSLPSVEGRLKSLHLVAKGNPLLPQSLNATLSVVASSLGYGEYRGGDLGLNAELKSGRLVVDKVTAMLGGNRIEVDTQVDMPVNWADLAQAAMELRWKLAAGHLAEIKGLPVSLRGSLLGEGAVALENKKIGKLSARLSGRDLMVDGHSLRALDVKADGDLESIRFEANAEAVAGDGALKTKGVVSMLPGTESELHWALNVPQPEALAKVLHIDWPADTKVGKVVSEGEIHAELEALKSQHFDKLHGSGSLMVNDASWCEAPVSVAAQWSLENGEAVVKGLSVSLPGDNALKVSGRMALAAPQAFEGSVRLALPKIEALGGWLTAVNVAGLHSGALSLDWQGRGQLKDVLSLAGSGKLSADAVKYDGLPGLATLAMDFSHGLDAADIASLKASVGPWHVSLRGSGSKTAVSIDDLKVGHERLDLLRGHVHLPLDLAAKPVPLAADKSMDVRIETTAPLTTQVLNQLKPEMLPAELRGTANGVVESRGTLAALDARVEVKLANLVLPSLARLPGQQPGQCSVLATLKKGELSVTTEVDVKPLERLKAELGAKLDLPALIAKPETAMDVPFTGSVQLHQPSLAFLKPLVPMLNELVGSVDIDLKAVGSGHSPKITGAVVVELPKVVPHDPDLPLVKDFKLRLTGHDTLLVLESLHASAAGGAVDVTGTCDLKDAKQPVFDVKLTARDLLAVRNEMMTLRTDADLQCKGTPKAAALTGSIGLTRGRVLQEIDFLPLNKMVNDLPPLPDEKTSKPSDDVVASASPVPPMFKDWTFGLAVKTKDPIRLLGNVMSGDAVLDLQLAGTGAAPVMTGTANIERGRLSLPFSTLHIKTGQVTFLPDKLMAPSLELLAESTVDAYEIALRGYGSVLAPKLRFSSTPPLAEGEIATLLATGATTSGLQKAGGDTASRAVWLLLRSAYRRVFVSNNKSRGKKDEPESESRFLVQEQSENGSVGGVTGIYEISKKMKIVSSSRSDGGFRAMFHYLFRFD